MPLALWIYLDSNGLSGLREKEAVVQMLRLSDVLYWFRDTNVWQDCVFCQLVISPVLNTKLKVLIFLVDRALVR